jgi:hypothetical protein
MVFLQARGRVDSDADRPMTSKRIFVGHQHEPRSVRDLEHLSPVFQEVEHADQVRHVLRPYGAEYPSQEAAQPQSFIRRGKLSTVAHRSLLVFAFWRRPDSAHAWLNVRPRSQVQISRL